MGRPCATGKLRLPVSTVWTPEAASILAPSGCTAHGCSGGCGFLLGSAVSRVAAFGEWCLCLRTAMCFKHGNPAGSVSAAMRKTTLHAFWYCCLPTPVTPDAPCKPSGHKVSNLFLLGEGYQEQEEGYRTLALNELPFDARSHGWLKAQSVLIGLSQPSSIWWNCGGMFRNWRHETVGRFGDRSKAGNDTVHTLPRLSEKVVSRIPSDDNLVLALARVQKNRKRVPGVDGKTVMNVCKSLLQHSNLREALRAEIANGTHQPSPIKRVYIPKTNGKLRALGIGTVQDTIVQRAIVQAVTPTLESHWSDNSYGYRTGRSLFDVLEKVEKYHKQGLNWAIAMDLSSFFDAIDHARLMAKVQQLFPEGSPMVDLIHRFLTCEIQETGKPTVSNTRGVPQGSVLGPMLANLYLDELDQVLTARGHAFVRYADDITILVKSRHAAKRVLDRTAEYLETRMDCAVNRDKTVITPTAEISLLGVERHNSVWRLPVETFTQISADVQATVKALQQEFQPDIWDRMVSSLQGKFAHYSRIRSIREVDLPVLKAELMAQIRSLEGRNYDLRGLLRRRTTFGRVETTSRQTAA